MAERMGRFLSALHSANQPKVKVGQKVKAIKGGDFSGTVERVKNNGSVSFRHSDGRLYRTHHTNLRVVKEDTDSEGDTMQVDEAIKPKSKEDEGEYGYEGDMAMSQLRSIIRNSQAMLDNLEPETDLPEWVQSKITLAKDYIETSANYLMSELEEERRTNDVARKFIGARQERERQRKRLGEPKIYESVSDKATRAANKLIGKKRKSLVNLKPQTDSMPMHGNMMTQAPTSDASAPSPGIK